MQTFERNTDAVRLFSDFTVSTCVLRDALLEIHPSALVTILPNAVPASLLSFVQAKPYAVEGARPFVGYYPGTATHDDDFRVAAPGVAEFCRSRGIPFRVVGPLAIDPELFEGVEMERRDILPFVEMFDSLAECRVVIAPLVDSRFNSAKSHIKLLEASLACTPCVASAIPDMVSCAEGLLTGALVPPGGDWASAIATAWDGYSPEAAAQTRVMLADRFRATRLVAPIFERTL